MVQEAAFADPSLAGDSVQRQGGDTVGRQSSPPIQAADGGDGRDLFTMLGFHVHAGIIPTRRYDYF
jgi:hypothetical protein